MPIRHCISVVPIMQCEIAEVNHGARRNEGGSLSGRSAPIPRSVSRKFPDSECSEVACGPTHTNLPTDGRP